jgi:acyl-CoA thioesterase FadM
MFELVKALTVDVANGSARGYAVVPAEHPLLRDCGGASRHVPETWLLEIMAQVAGPLAEAVDAALSPSPRWALLGMVRRARFEKPLTFSVPLEVSATVLRRAEASVTLGVEAWCGDERCAGAQAVMILIEASSEFDQARRERLSRLERWRGAWQER